MDTIAPPVVAIAGPAIERAKEVLTEEALAFLGALHRRFDGRRRDLLAARAVRQARFDAGERPDFLASTAAVRDGDWKVAPIPADLLDRRVEITGPVDRKMIINALNSGAKVFMADFEDATSPTWRNLIEGQLGTPGLEGQGAVLSMLLLLVLLVPMIYYVVATNRSSREAM